MEELLTKFVDDILILDDDMLYEMCGNRPDLCLFLNSGIHYFDRFNEKMEIMKPYFQENVLAGNETVLSDEILEFTSQLKIKNYLARFDNAKYKMSKLITDSIDIDNRDVLYFLFLSFGDYLYDDLKISKEDLKYVYFCFLGGTIPYELKSIHGDTIDDIKHDMLLYISAFQKHKFNILEYHHITKHIISKELNPAKNPRDILYNRLYTNFSICVATKYSKIKKIESDDQLKYFINMMLFGIFFDDIEDIQEDISNGTPTYVSWLYENNEYSVFVKKINQIMAYIYYINMEGLKKYRNLYWDKIVLLDTFKLLVLTNFGKTIPELEKQMCY